MSRSGGASIRIDRKLAEVAIAEFLYRHEAEFAAGFLEDAGIPYRLQIDDAGGADLGVTIARPGRLWVRGIDVEAAREVLDLDGSGADASILPDSGWDAAAVPSPPPAAPRSRGGSAERLCAVERTVAAALAIFLCAVALSGTGGGAAGAWAVTSWWAPAAVTAGAFLLGVSVVGRAPAWLRATLRALSGVSP